jgi:hypothetical protein
VCDIKQPHVRTSVKGYDRECLEIDIVRREVFVLRTVGLSTVERLQLNLEDKTDGSVRSLRAIVLIKQ